jgi:hypothetical protein
MEKPKIEDYVYVFDFESKGFLPFHPLAQARIRNLLKQTLCQLRSYFIKLDEFLKVKVDNVSLHRSPNRDFVFYYEAIYVCRNARGERIYKNKATTVDIDNDSFKTILEIFVALPSLLTKIFIKPSETLKEKE